MDMPDSLRAALCAADEDYLLGLCNKGIYNRAKKDYDAKCDTITAQPKGDGVEVDCGDAKCDICVPLGKSTCSCPSSAMCRHRITAIFWLKAHTDAAETKAAAVDTAPTADNTDTPAAPAEKPDGEPAPRFAALLAYPAEKLCRQLGTRKIAAMLFRVGSDGLPAMRETSVVSMELPWIPASVRLLEPLEYSTCSCHKTGLCDHKAEALLLFQLAHGVVTTEQLEPEKTEGGAPDAEAVAGVCAAVRQALTGQMTTGLSRMSPTVCDTMERMAALSHVAQLPALEKQLRALGGEYAAYFARSATFRDTELLRRLSDCFLLAQALETAETPGIRRKLAGSFHAEYCEVGSLSLYLLGARSFSGRGGYAGNIYYFWEMDKHRYYTYTAVRPTFYEESARRRPPNAPQPAPWGLPCSMESLCGMTLTLSRARATAEGRLSATAQSRAEAGKDCNAGSIMPPETVYTDFSVLLAEKADDAAPETEHIACVRAVRCSVPDYDTVQQVFSLILYDEKGRDLFIEVHYRKEEKQLIRVLERLAARLKTLPEEVPVFFGSVYTEDEKIKMYPIEFFTDWEAEI